MKEIFADYFWILTRWYYLLAVFAGVIVGWWLFRRRVYIISNGKLFVRHGQLGKWIDVEEHLQQEHPLEWTMLQQYKGKEKGQEKGGWGN